jgi:hypothetical protein
MRHTTGPTIGVKRAIAHDYYNDNVDNDIAILILSKRIPRHRNSNAIKISLRGDPTHASIITISGLGFTFVPPIGDLQKFENC